MRFRYKTVAFILVLAMLVPTFTGCVGSEGASSPEKLVEKYIDGGFSGDIDKVLDCLPPLIADIYRGTVSILTIAASPQKDVRTFFKESLLSVVARDFDTEITDVSKIKNKLYIVSKQQDAQKAVVRIILSLEVNGMVDYGEAYVFVEKINKKWYFSNAAVSVADYSPTKVMIKDSKVEKIVAELEEKKQLTLINRPIEVAENFIINNTPVTKEMKQSTWDAIDRFATGKNPIFDGHIKKDVPPGYMFEAFVEEYQGDLGRRGLTAGLVTTDVVLHLPDDIISYNFGGAFEDTRFVRMFDADSKKSGIIIDYLSTVNFEAEMAKVEKLKVDVEVSSEFTAWYDKLFKMISSDIEDIIESGSSKITSLENELRTKLSKNELWDGRIWDNIEAKISSHIARKTSFTDGDIAEILSEIPVKVKGPANKTYKLGDIYTINEGSVDDIYSYIKRAFKSGKGLQIDALSNEISEYIDVEFMLDYTNRASGKNVQKITARVMDELNEIKGETEIKKIEVERAGKLKKVAGWAEKFIQFAGAAFESMNAYNQYYQYGVVLDKFEAELREILVNSGYYDAEELIEEVLNKLIDVTAESGVKIATEAFARSLATEYLKEGMEFLVKESGKAVLRTATWVLFVVEVTYNALSYLAGLSDSYLKIWGVEDMYREYLKTKSALGNAMLQYYNRPNDDNYKKLYYTAKYYSLLVLSSSTEVSKILCADFDSAKSKFINFVTNIGKSGDPRLEAIAEAKKYPAHDKQILDDFLNRLLPGISIGF